MNDEKLLSVIPETGDVACYLLHGEDFEIEKLGPVLLWKVYEHKTDAVALINGEPINVSNGEYFYRGVYIYATKGSKPDPSEDTLNEVAWRWVKDKADKFIDGWSYKETVYALKPDWIDNFWDWLVNHDDRSYVELWLYAEGEDNGEDIKNGKELLQIALSMKDRYAVAWQRWLEVVAADKAAKREA